MQHVVPDVALDVQLAPAAGHVSPQRQGLDPLLGQDRVAEDKVEAADSARASARPRQAGDDLGHARGQAQADVAALHFAGEALGVVHRLGADEPGVLLRLLRAAEPDADPAAAIAGAGAGAAGAFEYNLDA